MKFFISITFVFISIVLSFGQAAESEIEEHSKKELYIKRISDAPKIDGVLDENLWKEMQAATNFVMFRPGNGNPIPKDYDTQVKFCYDDEALYVGAYLKDPNPETIPMQFTTRDNFGQTDFFLLGVNPNNDGVNDTEFVVMSTGTQADAKVSTTNGEDFGWSAVWDSAVQLHDDGWSLEMRIPYSALRFSGENLKEWGLNIHRRIQSKKEQYSWNFIDKSKGTYTEYSGLLKGIKDIDTPVRLSLYPYAQGTITSYYGETDFNGTAGMDIKYGINDSFTLDATLIPDFGQTAYDDVVLNLGPFEQQYDEKRAFFTEGVEMFAKGDLIYSRRIGGRPYLGWAPYSDLEENEEVDENPEKSKLINALKLTGRTQGGLGIGLFNGISAHTEATIKNTITGETRKFTTSPLTNYNAIVLDQQFKNTSSVTFVNTNVARKGSYTDANVSSLLSDIRLFKNKYRLTSEISMSNRFHDNTDTGWLGSLYFRNMTGKHRFTTGMDFADTRYNKNDMGYIDHNNYLHFYGYYGYRIFEPKGNLNSLYLNVNMNYHRLLDPSVYTGNNFNINMNMTNKNELSYGWGGNFSFGDEKDYYEPRVPGRFFVTRNINNAFVWISTDYRKKFAFDATLVYGTQLGIKDPLRGPYFEVAPRYRFSDKFQMVYQFSKDITKSWIGHVDNIEGDIFFGKRDGKTYINELSSTYNFSTKSALSLSLRHYWSPIKYTGEFYTLNENGSLSDADYTENPEENYNAWNFDLGYTWEFAPGSQLITLYRNSLYENDYNPHVKFGKNLSNLFKNPLEQQLSLRLVYYLDYNKLKS